MISCRRMKSDNLHLLKDIKSYFGGMFCGAEKNRKSINVFEVIDTFKCKIHRHEGCVEGMHDLILRDLLGV